MNRRALLLRKMDQTLGLLLCEARTPRSYGTGQLLSSSDIGLLLCVERNQSARAGELSQYLGITNGAVTQLAKKMAAKGYLEPYRLAGNKKEIYYRLTLTGQDACRGYRRHCEKAQAGVGDYLSGLDDATVDAIAGLFDKMAQSANVAEHCSLLAPDAGERESGMKRCEKCQRIY